MKKVLTLLCCIALISCKKEVKKEETKTAPVIETKTTKEKSTTAEKDVNETDTQYSHKNAILENVMVPFTPRFFNEISDHHDLLGFYVGKFVAVKYGTNKKPTYSNKINISINHIAGDSVFGHSVVAGNTRPFRGNFDTTSFKAKVYEPGDDKYDGVFEFNIQPNGQILKGSWIANDNKLAVTERKYKLKKEIFVYNSDKNLVNEGDEDNYYEGNIFTDLYNDSSDPNNDGPESEYATVKSLTINASNTKLTNNDLENLFKGDLEIIRNGIYARHGYSFKNRKMRYFFDSQIDWYIPVSTDVRNALTDLEKKNIALIKRYEEHAEKYYDYFGR